MGLLRGGVGEIVGGRHFCPTSANSPFPSIQFSQSVPSPFTHQFKQKPPSLPVAASPSHLAQPTFSAPFSALVYRHSAHSHQSVRLSNFRFSLNLPFSPNAPISQPFIHSNWPLAAKILFITLNHNNSFKLMIKN